MAGYRLRLRSRLLSEKYLLREKYTSRPMAIAIITVIVPQKPAAECSQGMKSKFMPNTPAIKLSGRKTAVMAVSVRMTSLARLLWILK